MTRSDDAGSDEGSEEGKVERVVSQEGKRQAGALWWRCLWLWLCLALIALGNYQFVFLPYLQTPYQEYIHLHLASP